MKHLYLAIILCISLSGCTVLKQEVDSPKLDGVTWRLTAIKDKPISIDGDKAFMEFVGKDKVSGKAACNSFSGEYSLPVKNQIAFEDLASTKMYCEGVMDIEGQMLTGLKEAKKYEVKANMLYLYSLDGLLLTFKR